MGTMKAGELYRVSGAAGVHVCEVSHAADPSEFAEIDRLSCGMSHVVAILREWNIDLVVMFDCVPESPESQERLSIFALLRTSGELMDLWGHELRVERCE